MHDKFCLARVLVNHFFFRCFLKIFSPLQLYNKNGLSDAKFYQFGEFRDEFLFTVASILSMMWNFLDEKN